MPPPDYNEEPTKLEADSDLSTDSSSWLSSSSLSSDSDVSDEPSSPASLNNNEPITGQSRAVYTQPTKETPASQEKKKLAPVSQEKKRKVPVQESSKKKPKTSTSGECKEHKYHPAASAAKPTPGLAASATRLLVPKAASQPNLEERMVLAQERQAAAQERQAAALKPMASAEEALFCGNSTSSRDQTSLHSKPQHQHTESKLLEPGAKRDKGPEKEVSLEKKDDGEDGVLLGTELDGRFDPAAHWTRTGYGV